MSPRGCPRDTSNSTDTNANSPLLSLAPAPHTHASQADLLPSPYFPPLGRALAHNQEAVPKQVSPWSGPPHMSSIFLPQPKGSLQPFLRHLQAHLFPSVLTLSHDLTPLRMFSLTEISNIIPTITDWVFFCFPYIFCNPHGNPARTLSYLGSKQCTRYSDPGLRNPRALLSSLLF